MKTRSFAFTWLLLGVSLTQASSNETLVGRSYLVQRNLTNANAWFAQGSDAESKTLKAITSLALLQRDSGTVTFFNNLYVDSPANIWDARDLGYSANPSTPTPYLALNNPNASQLATILRNVHLPVYLQAETDLSAFTSDSLLVPLGRSETGYPDISLDRGDILMIRALLACGRGVAHLINAHNSSMLVNELLSLREEAGPVTIEIFLARFADVGKLANAADLPLARQEFKTSIALYQQASEWIRTQRPTGVVRLFNLPGSLGVKDGELYTAALTDEAMFRAKLDEYALLLDGSRLITGFDNQPIDTFNGQPFFDGQVNLRSILPAFRKNKIRQGDVTQAFATLGGIYPGNTAARTEDWLLQLTQDCPTNPYELGLFIPPHLTLNCPTGNSVSEGYHPPDVFLALGYSWGCFDDDGLGLFWVNSQTGDFSKLNPQPIDPGIGYPQEAWISGSNIYFRSNDWSTWPAQSYLHEVNITNGGLIRTIPLTGILPSGEIYAVLNGQSDFVIVLYSYSDGRYHIYRMNKTSLAAQEMNFGTNALNYIVWGSWTLDPSGQSLWLAGGNNVIPGTNCFKFRISDGSLLQSVQLNQYPNWQKVVAGKNGLIALKQINWPMWSLVSVNYTTGQESVLNGNLLPGRQYDWNSGLTLDSTGENVFLRSLDMNWNDQRVQLFSGTNGQLLQSCPIGVPGKDLYALTTTPSPGAVLVANRTGDVSEPISVSISLNGTASNGLDYTFPIATISLLPGNTQQPIPLGLINDNVLELDETVRLTGTSDPESDSTIQAFTLTILDDDGSGVGIIATDNAGKEGRMDPDPFGFRFGIYDPIRFEIRRTGSTTSAISVKVSRDALLSSASLDDYEIAGFDVDGQSVRIPAGSSSAEIVVKPKFDLDYPEGTESINLKINPDPAYTLIQSASSASGSLEDSSPYEWWSYQMGLLIANQSPALDTDHDGMPNLLEMALGRDPNLSDSQDSVKVGTDSEGYLTLTFRRWSGGSLHEDGSYSQYGVTYRPQASSGLELATWSSSSIQVRSITDTGDGMEEVVVRDNLSKTIPSRFMRLSVSL